MPNEKGKIIGMIRYRKLNQYDSILPENTSVICSGVQCRSLSIDELYDRGFGLRHSNRGWFATIWILDARVRFLTEPNATTLEVFVDYPYTKNKYYKDLEVVCQIAIRPNQFEYVANDVIQDICDHVNKARNAYNLENDVFPRWGKIEVHGMTMIVGKDDPPFILDPLPETYKSL